MLAKIQLRNLFSYKIIKKVAADNSAPLPNMEQYFLANDNNTIISFWNDIPLNYKNDSVTCCIEIPKEKCNKFEVIKS
jgi:hypothetical protein